MAGNAMMICLEFLIQKMNNKKDLTWNILQFVVYLDEFLSLQMKFVLIAPIALAKSYFQETFDNGSKFSFN